MLALYLFARKKGVARPLLAQKGLGWGEEERGALGIPRGIKGREKESAFIRRAPARGEKPKSKGRRLSS